MLQGNLLNNMWLLLQEPDIPLFRLVGNHGNTMRFQGEIRTDQSPPSMFPKGFNAMEQLLKLIKTQLPAYTISQCLDILPGGCP